LAPQITWEASDLAMRRPMNLTGFGNSLSCSTLQGGTSARIGRFGTGKRKE
jgi:hypothetical protein